MLPQTIDYHIAQLDSTWGIFREGMQIAVRADPADAIAFANFFADRETLMAPCPVRVSADMNLHQALLDLRQVA
ncbi:hypothetical protein [Luteibacter sp. UNCMF366Tsu5.1]|uniref:hypothetical protein n=1 Tax=Luteibacter sp. UNCMF366Tsu5.1 TaxID=1502758 RepID=UPI0009086234|nr:hypothetical protein [Luteibacter sp. UNCMF366Tsu5.1]SFW74782.1 hypothetical protein SAMN02800691_3474 [Luteibacter sp. UNCMF366Tsu5.1]